MAHFSELDENGNVIKTVVVANEVITDSQGVEQEQLGIDFLNNLFGFSIWKQTSYNTKAGKYYDPITDELAKDQSKTFRKNYGVPGFKYDQATDSFVETDSYKPYSDWILDSATGRWKAPVDEPSSWSHNGASSDQDGYSVELTRFMGHFPEADGSLNRVWFSYNNTNNSWELMNPQPITVIP
jgi:hypothetical protein